MFWDMAWNEAMWSCWSFKTLSFSMMWKISTSLTAFPFTFRKASSCRSSGHPVGKSTDFPPDQLSFCRARAVKFWWTARASTDGAATAGYMPQARPAVSVAHGERKPASADGDSRWHFPRGDGQACGGNARARRFIGWGDKRPEEACAACVSVGIRAYAADRLGTAAAR